MKNTLLTCGLLAVTASLASQAFGGTPEMVELKRRGFDMKVLHTVGESVPSYTSFNLNDQESYYTPVGIMDGMGAYEVNPWTVRVFVNHELLNFRGHAYYVSDGSGGTIELNGARVSYFDIDKKTCEIKSGGLAYHSIYDADGNQATDNTFLANDQTFVGLSRFCSASLFEPLEWGDRGLEDRIFFTGEEDGGSFNPVGGAEWALDPATGNFWHLPDLGRGAWENVTILDTGTTDTVAVLLADDTSPFNADAGDMEDEAAPLYLYVGVKNPAGDFPAKNGLRGGKLYVWVSNTGEVLPSEFLAAGNSLAGKFVEIDNSPNLGMADEEGDNGFDEYGYPTQSTLWTRAEMLGAFGFSRPEDVATNPRNGAEAALASTGVDTYDTATTSGDGADTFGTVYKVVVDFAGLNSAALPMEIPSTVSIIYDGDADPMRKLRSPDNLDWADDGMLYVQEDKAETDTLVTMEPLFGPGAVNECEAQIVRLNPNSGEVTAIAQVDRSVVLDPTSIGEAVDVDAGEAGAWETTGIVDVSYLFDKLPGSLFLFNVQAHGIEDQNNYYPDSRITDFDLREGGQMIMLQKKTALEAALENRVKKLGRKIKRARRKGDKKKIRKFKRQQNKAENNLDDMF